ncbi:MAG: sulfocyanin-like copper-binding protein, partial [Candidatus Limnocylindria bacterium]
VKNGSVKFGVKNAGGMEHSFELIKTDLPFDKLPVDIGAAKAKEDGLIKQVKTLGVGKVAVITADLAAGNYVVICNVAGHYQLGMRVGLTVQ